ncbi:MAG: ComF family protein [Ruminococcus sp.]|nr:ComF family protein [Ruminococcus sp.]
MFILDLFFPNRCPVCDDVIAYDAMVCDSCKEKLKNCFTDENKVCNVCGKTSCTPHDDLYYSRTLSCYYYDSYARDGILSLKDGSKNFGNHIADMLAEKIMSDDIMKNADFITAVPMSKTRFRERGYNQAQVIAKEISDKTGIKLLCNALFKNMSAVQHSLSYEERLKNVEAFYAADIDLSGKRIIICDDVLTTGSTINKCAQLLVSINAAEVYAAVGTTKK